MTLGTVDYTLQELLTGTYVQLTLNAAYGSAAERSEGVGRRSGSSAVRAGSCRPDERNGNKRERNGRVAVQEGVTRAKPVGVSAAGMSVSVMGA